MKPYFERDGITIYHGDALDASFSGLRVVVDPPYGRGHYDTDRALPDAFYRALVEAHPTVAVFSYPEDLAWLTTVVGKRPQEWVTWWPTNKTGGRSKTTLPKEQEAVAVWGALPGPARLTRPRVRIPGAVEAIHEGRGNSLSEARMGDVWRDAAPGMAFNAHLRKHPNEKPLSLMRRLVLLCSNPGETVLDPCAGSGTTLEAAYLEGRRAIGIEIKENYCEIAAKRLEQMVLPLEMAA